MGSLWECPRCGRRFANRNQWHSCLELTVEEHLAGKSELAGAIYREVVGALGRCGVFRTHPQKSRVAFIARMTFAGLRLAERWADLSFITPTPVPSHRIRRVDLYGPTSWGHVVRLRAVDAVDDEVVEWLCRAHRRGEQETLDPRATVAPVPESLLGRLHIPLRCRVLATTSGPVLRVPGYVTEALAEQPGVVARIAGQEAGGTIVAAGGDHELRLDGSLLRELGLGAGDHTDVVLEPAR